MKANKKQNLPKFFLFFLVPFLNNYKSPEHFDITKTTSSLHSAFLSIQT